MNKQRKVLITVTYNELGIIIDTKAEEVAQLDRDIPKKPNKTTDRSWGIPHRQAVCPNCDSYLGTIHFIGEGYKRKVTYCESCGQAIDWEGW